MYKDYIVQVIGCKDINELDIEDTNRLYRELLLKTYSGDVVLLKVQTKEQLKEIYASHDIVNQFYTVKASYKLFYEGFMAAYSDIVKSNGLEAYFDKNSEEKIKYIGKKYHKLENDNAYDTVKERLFSCDETKIGCYSTYDIIFELRDQRYIFVIYEDIDVKNKVISLSKEVIQSFIDKMILDKYNIQKGEN